MVFLELIRLAPTYFNIPGAGVLNNNENEQNPVLVA